MLIILTLSFVSCSDADDTYSCPDGKLVATSDAADYYFFYPSDWRADRADGMISVVAGYDPSNGKSEASVSVTDFKASGLKDGEEYWTKHLSEYQATFADMEIIEEKTITIANVEFPFKTYTASVGGVKYKYSQVFIYNSPRIYIITYTASEDDYDTYIADFDELATTFRGK